jgi:NAD(P)-dependent dehydrogenase (short-subunit alcohol dehydrogenase family)
LTSPAAIYPDLRGKVALVTGGSKGIGAATCAALVENGVRVAVNGRSQEAVDSVVAELGGGAIAAAGDCTSEADVAAIRSLVESELGPVELLVAFAGGFESFTPIADFGLAEWREVVEQNLTSTFVTVREFLPSMIEARRGSIVTVSSGSVRVIDKRRTRRRRPA